jgi:hypothetical protein
MTPTQTQYDRNKLLGKRITWLANYDPCRSCGILRRGTVFEVKHKNLLVGETEDCADWQWIDDMQFLEVVS